MWGYRLLLGRTGKDKRNREYPLNEPSTWTAQRRCNGRADGGVPRSEGNRDISPEINKHCQFYDRKAPTLALGLCVSSGRNGDSWNSKVNFRTAEYYSFRWYEIH